MSLGHHLVELRRRLTRAAIAVLLGTIASFWLVAPVWQSLSAPVLAVGLADDRETAIQYTRVTEAFDTTMIIAVTLGFVVSSPVWLYQLWAFIVPALHQREKRYAIGFIAAAVPLFLAGCAAGWLLLPNIVRIMAGFAAADTFTLFTAQGYLDFSLKLILAIGIGFVLPVVLVMLNFARVMSAQTILRGWRWAIVAIAAFTAIATPAADVVSMILLALPMVGLYFIAAAIAVFHDRRLAKRESSFAAEYGIDPAPA
jgi:sec-independent protein translocase protein TatC